MKRLGTVVGTGVLLLLMSGCADPQNSDAVGERPADSSTQTSAPASSEPDRQPARTPPSGGQEVAESQLDASALPADYPVLAWTENDGRTVGVVAQEGGCGKASVEVTAQSDSQVVLTIVETVPREPRPCTMDLRYPKLTTELDEPLAERTLVLKAEQRKG